MVEPELNPINKFNFIIVFIVSSIVAILSLSHYKRHVSLFLMVVFLTSAIPAVINSNEILFKGTNAKVSPSLSLSKHKNILIVSFDGLPGELTKDVIKENNIYKEALKDFVFFENAVSQAPATSASLLGDIYGVQDFKKKGDTLAEVRDYLKRDGSFSNITSQYIPDSYQYGYSGYDINGMAINSPIVSAQNKLGKVCTTSRICDNGLAVHFSRDVT